MTTTAQQIAQLQKQVSALSATQVKQAGQITTILADLELSPVVVPPVPAGRQWLMGWYTFGTPQSPTPTEFLGFTPEIEYDSSFEDFGFGGIACVYSGANGNNPCVIAVSLSPQGQEQQSQDYAGAAAGTYDAKWDEVIAGVVASPNHKNVYAVRIDPEFNLLNTFPGSTGPAVSPATYVAAWNRCAAKWKAAGFKTCWNPAVTTAGDTRGAVADYFPGPAHCDLVGIDVYTNSDWGLTAAALIGTATGVGTLEWYKAQNFGGLPICFPEWGDKYNLAGDGSQLAAIIQWMNALGPKFVMGNWWNGTGAGAPIGPIGVAVMQANIPKIYSGAYWGALQPTNPFPNYKP